MMDLRYAAVISWAVFVGAMVVLVLLVRAW